MAPPISVAELLSLIRKSGVVREKTLAEFLAGRALDESADARPLAEDMIAAGVLTHFQSEQLLQGKWRGFTIGRYRYLERIGVGGMGQVFLCEDVEDGRRVAIKVLPPAKAEQPAALGRFYREARAAAALAHANVVRTHDIGQDGDLHYIVMDYVRGVNLLDLVKRFGPLDVGRATSYVLQVARALDFAFRNGIIHRDVKPGNVIVDRHGVARLLDLGLARFLKDHGDPLTLKYDDKIVLGTADYVAPEQIENSHGADTRADVYALGSTFYFLLAGHPPFPTGSVSQKLLWHRTKEPAPIREARADVPEGLAVVLAKMMSKDPRERFQTPAQLVTELHAWVPESVPLPGPDEMPRLSPAAETNLGREPDLATDAASQASETARVASPTPTGLPTFGAAVPMAAGLAPERVRPAVQSESDTRAVAVEQTPPPPRRDRRAGKAHPRAPAPTPGPAGARVFPWGALGAVVLAVLAGILLLVT